MHRLELPGPLGPEPDQVDVHVPGQDRLARRGVGGQRGEQGGRLLPHRLRAAAIEGIHRRVEPHEDPPSQRIEPLDRRPVAEARGHVAVQRVGAAVQRDEEAQQHLHVEGRRPGVAVPRAEEGTFELGSTRADALPGTRHPDARAGADRLDPQRPARRGEAVGQPQPLVPGVDAADRLPLDIGRRLALVPPVEVHAAAGPALAGARGHLHRPPALLEAPPPPVRQRVHRRVRQRSRVGQRRLPVGRLALEHPQRVSSRGPGLREQALVRLADPRRQELEVTGLGQHRRDSKAAVGRGRPRTAVVSRQKVRRSAARSVAHADRSGTCPARRNHRPCRPFPVEGGLDARDSRSATQTGPRPPPPERTITRGRGSGPDRVAIRLRRARRGRGADGLRQPGRAQPVRRPLIHEAQPAASKAFSKISRSSRACSQRSVSSRGRPSGPGKVRA